MRTDDADHLVQPAAVAQFNVHYSESPQDLRNDMMSTPCSYETLLDPICQISPVSMVGIVQLEIRADLEELQFFA